MRAECVIPTTRYFVKRCSSHSTQTPAKIVVNERLISFAGIVSKLGQITAEMLPGIVGGAIEAWIASQGKPVLMGALHPFLGAALPIYFCRYSLEGLCFGTRLP